MYHREYYLILLYPTNYEVTKINNGFLICFDPFWENYKFKNLAKYKFKKKRNYIAYSQDMDKGMLIVNGVSTLTHLSPTYPLETTRLFNTIARRPYNFGEISVTISLNSVQITKSLDSHTSRGVKRLFFVLRNRLINLLESKSFMNNHTILNEYALHPIASLAKILLETLRFVILVISLKIKR